MAHPWKEKRPISSWVPGGLSQKELEAVSRMIRPVIDNNLCKKCNLCWIYCPEGCISRKEKYVVLYEYCKGCGVCAAKCPSDAITMVKEVQE